MIGLSETKLLHFHGVFKKRGGGGGGVPRRGVEEANSLNPLWIRHWSLPLNQSGELCLIHSSCLQDWTESADLSLV